MSTHPAADCALLLRGLHEALEIPHQSEEEWENQERLRELRTQEITPEMVAEFEAMDADRK